MPRRPPALLLKPSTWVVPYVVLWFLAGLLPIQPTDLDIFFWPSAKVAVAGHPLLVYSAGGQALYPNANGPVALAPLTVVGLFLKAVGWLDSIPLRRAVALAVFSLFVLLMAREAIGAIERLRGARLERYARVLTYAVLALCPQAWQSVAGYGHIEQPIEIWLVLVSVRWLERDRQVRAGVAYALAVLSRTPAILLAVPLGLASLRRGPGSAARLAASTVATGVAGLLPFLLADPSDVIHSLFTYRGGLGVGAGSVWSLTRGGPYELVVQHWDAAAVAALVVATNLWLATRPGGLDQARVFAAMTLTAASFALLAKTVWAYYFFEVFVFGTVWAFGRWQKSEGVVRLVLLPIAISIFGLVAEAGSAPDLTPRLVAVEGAGMFAMLGLTIVWILWLSGVSGMRKTGIAEAPAPLQEVWK